MPPGPVAANNTSGADNTTLLSRVTLLAFAAIVTLPDPGSIVPGYAPMPRRGAPIAFRSATLIETPLKPGVGVPLSISKFTPLPSITAVPPWPPTPGANKPFPAKIKAGAEGLRMDE